MNYIDIFYDIVSITHKDYSGCLDKKGWDNPQSFREKIVTLSETGELDDVKFRDIVEDYLLDFRDDHMHFRLMTNNERVDYDNGFKIRRYEDKLYVTYVGKENRIPKGIAITSLDGISIKELGEKYRRQLQVLGTHPEREPWENVILKHKKCNLEDKLGNELEIELKRFEKEKYVPEYSIKELQNGILLMKLTDFNDDDKINKLIEDNKAVLSNSKNLIIDVRFNRGGSDSAYLKLSEYLFKEEIDLNELDDGEMLFNMTERNYKLRMEQFNSYLGIVEDLETRRFLEIFIKEMNKYRDKGFVKLDLSDAISESKIYGKANPENIVVLEDVYCKSSGDAFVSLAGKSEKVTLMGRGSAGITDYSNLASQPYGEGMQFNYPTSRMSSIDEGRGLTGVGVAPKVYIPWTPEHIDRDIDLLKAVEFLTK